MTNAIISVFSGLLGGIGNVPNAFVSYGVVRLGKRLNVKPEYSLSGYHDVERVTQEIIAAHRKNPARPVCLIGHSNGGYAVIQIAIALEKVSIPVAYMGIIELTAKPTPAVPGNVKILDHFEATFSAVNAANKLLLSADFRNNGGRFERFEYPTTHIALADNDDVQQRIIDQIGKAEGADQPEKEPDMTGTLFERWTPVFMKMLMDDFAVGVEDAAAVFGNAGHESAGYEILQEIKPVVPGSRGGYGIMQWTGPRRKDFEAYCDRNGYSPSDLMVNYKWLFVELTGPEGKALNKLRNAVGLEAKTRVFSEVFLRPGIPHMASRIQWAERASKAWQDVQTTVPAPIEPPDTLPAPVEPSDGELAGFLAGRYPDTTEQARTHAAMLADALAYRLSTLSTASPKAEIPAAIAAQSEKENPMQMDDVKKWWQSLGVNGGLGALLSMALVLTGYDVPVETVTDLGDKLVELIGIVSAVASIIGRIRATKLID